MYYTADGQEWTRQEIITAVSERRAVLLQSHGNWCTLESLMIYEDAEVAEETAEIDTRGECYSVWDECWGELVTSARRALSVARCIH